MQWSKLRSRLLSFVAPELRKRVDFHLICYRKLSEVANELLITVDGKKVFSASTSRYNIATNVLTRRTGLVYFGDGPNPKKVDDILIQREIYDPSAITSSMRTYLDLPLHTAIRSTDPILRSLAMIDRRTGRRTLNDLELARDEHLLVKVLYNLRMECFDLPPGNKMVKPKIDGIHLFQTECKERKGEKDGADKKL